MKDTPHRYPYAFELVPNARIGLFDQNGKQISMEGLYPEGWSKVSKCVFDGKDVDLKPHRERTIPQELEKLRMDGSQTYYALPVDGIKQHVTGISAISLAEGTILILGGSIVRSGKKWLVPPIGRLKGDNMSPLQNSWFYFPKDGILKPGPSMTYRRRSPNLSLLKDGRVLITGGWMQNPSDIVDKAELFDPKKDKFIALSDMRFPRVAHGTAELSDGDVLIVGGRTIKSLSDSGYSLTATAEILDMSSGKFRLIGQLNKSRKNPIVIPLDKNHALVCGGEIDQSENSDQYSEFVVEPELFNGKYQEIDLLKN